MQLIPMDPEVTVSGGSSDHTILDMTESKKEWQVGDTVDFSLYYMALLYCFATRNVEIKYV